MIRYDYEAIDTAISMMQKKAQEIATQTDEQQSQVQAIMQGWEGSTALAYNQLCDDLEKDLRDNIGILEQLKTTFQQGANDMQELDARGGKNVYG